MTLPASRPNRLIREGSPYLLQHAHNPVDWFPWGREALDRARAEDRPVLLSIGYATCHWCHVMEAESFDDPEIADLMNRHFVCIKVDREERPDLDQIYMKAATALTGSGGWPLNVFLTPDLHPFFGGTYFPPVAGPGGRPSWPEILSRIAAAWADPEERERIRASGGKITGFLQEEPAGGRDRVDPDLRFVNQALERLRGAFDARWGGFGRSPKFPSPPTLAFLLTAAASPAMPEASRPVQADALDMALHTLERMADGGIFDQLGGGFHRYATDPAWRVPHFEKMLTDNALLIPVFLGAYSLSGRERFAETAVRTADYVLREMTHAGGGFFSAQDADSLHPDADGATGARKEEGAFYLWTREEVLSVAGEADGDVFCRRWGVEAAGNVAFDPHGEFKGRNILHAARSVEAVAADLGLLVETVRRRIERAAHRLFDRRNSRPRPQLDDKILTGWNGLMIGALARCGLVLGKDRYTTAAGKAADFVLTRLYDPDGRRLFRRWRNGDRRVPAMAEDYFFLIQGLLDLYAADLDIHWLRMAADLAESAIGDFYDADGGGFFMTAPDHDPHLILRLKADLDLAMPSAASVAALALPRLARMTGKQRFETVAEDTLRSGLARFGRHPEAVAGLLTALLHRAATPVLVVVTGSPGQPETRALLAAAQDPAAHGETVLLVRSEADSLWLGEGLPFIRSAVRVEGAPTAYACIDRSCKAPVTDPDSLSRLLGVVRLPATGGAK